MPTYKYKIMAVAYLLGPNTCFKTRVLSWTVLRVPGMFVFNLNLGALFIRAATRFWGLFVSGRGV